MLSSPGWRVLVREIAVQQLKEQKAIVQGRCADFEEYKSKVAFTDGMEFVTSLPVKMVERMEVGVKQMIARQEAE